MKRAIGFASVSLLGIMLGTAAQAQGQKSVEEDKSGGIADIVVTATRQSTNLQDTPIAITAVTAEALKDQGLKSVADLSAVVPNAQFRRVQGALGPGVTTFIRGLGTTDTSLGGEAAVAYYIDDVYYPILLGSNFDLLDIDHVEVLRGPQGTLFGRNSLAGAVNIVSKQPSLNEASGYGEVTIGKYDRRDFRMGFNLPISNTMAIMVSALSKQKTGYQKVLDFTCEMNRRGTPALAGNFPYANQQLTKTANFTPGDCTIGHLGGDDTQALRGAILWQPIDNLKVTLSADYTWDNSENPADYTVDINTALVPATIKAQAAYWGLAYDSRFLTGNPFTTYATYTDRIAGGTTIAGTSFYIGLPQRGGLIMDPVTHLKNRGYSAKIVYGITPDIDVTLVAGHREMDENHSFDNDSGPLVIEHVLSNIGEHYNNAELRVSGKMAWADWVVGAFYFDASGYFHATNYSPSNQSLKTLVTTYEPNSKAIFANATIHPLGPKLGIVLGARYSKDHKFVNYSNLVDTPTTHPNSLDTIFQVDPAQEKFSWKLGANYALTQDVLIYASAATGNSLPGYNTRPLQPSQVVSFGGNDDIAYEIGAKLDLFDRHVRINLAAFYTDFKNRPTGIGGAEPLYGADGKAVAGNQQLEPLPGGPDGSTRCSTTVLPTATGIQCLARTFYVNQPASARGFEVEYTINPIEHLSIGGSLGYSKFLSPEIEARTLNRRQSTPFWTANAGVQYVFQVDAIGGTITPRADWSWQSSEIISGTSVKYNDLVGARSLVNTRLTYDNEAHDFSVALGMTNLFNKHYYLNFFDYQALGRANTQAQPGIPRQWSLTVSKKF